jgi:hypothetical protein
MLDTGQRRSRCCLAAGCHRCWRLLLLLASPAASRQQAAQRPLAQP